LLIGAIIAVIGAHLLTGVVAEQRLATRSVYQSVALNLAEAGIEEAMWAANNEWIDSTRGWSPAGDGTGAMILSRTTGLTLAQGTGEYHLRIDQPASASPIVIALGIVRLPAQPPILKQVRVRLDRRAVWANAIVAKGHVTFNGNRTTIDAYDSAVGAWHATANRLDRATVATNLATNGGVAVNNADIYGYVATGGGAPQVGPNGSILSATSPSGLSNNVDPSNLRYDFSYNIPDAVAPTATAISIGAVTSSTTLPRPGDTPGADGRYTYSASSVSLTNSTLTINGAVDLVVSGNVSIGGGSGAIVLTNTTSTELALYAAGDISISGNGAANPTNSPPRMTFHGTRTAAQAATLGRQQFDLSGNADYSGLVYAPNADVSLRGGGSSGQFSGAIIAYSVTFNGNYDFHYDVQLASYQNQQRYFKPLNWIELTAAPGSGAALARDARAPFAGLF